MLNIRHGEGSLKTSTGETYDGNFREGLMHGQGVFTLKNGDQYDG